MSDPTAPATRDFVQQTAEQRGLARAYALSPQAMHAAAERGTRPLPLVASGPTTELAGCFDPETRARVP